MASQRCLAASLRSANYRRIHKHTTNDKETSNQQYFGQKMYQHKQCWLVLCAQARTGCHSESNNEHPQLEKKKVHEWGKWKFSTHRRPMNANSIETIYFLLLCCVRFTGPRTNGRSNQWAVFFCQRKYCFYWTKLISSWYIHPFWQRVCIVDDFYFIFFCFFVRSFVFISVLFRNGLD